MNNSPEIEFIREITSGLWIAPRKLHEVQQELYEHLDDLSEEKGITNWTQELLQKHLGTKEVLKNLYNQIYLPLWKRFLKWMIKIAVCILVLILIIDLYFLWLYTPDKFSQIYIQNINPFINNLIGYDLPKLEIAWIQPGDAVSQKTHDKFITAINCWQNYRDRAYIAREANENPRQQELTEDEYKTIWDNWVTFSTEDKLAFPRPQVTPDDIALLQSLIRIGEPALNPRKYKSQPWIYTAYDNQQFMNVLPKKLPVFEIIRAAKETDEICESINKMNPLVRESISKIPEDKQPQFVRANTHWLKLFWDSYIPNDLHLYGLSHNSVFAMSCIQKQLESKIVDLQSINIYKDSIQDFISIDLKKALTYIPTPSEMEDSQKKWSRMNSFAEFMSWLKPFRWQCSFMQFFCNQDSPSYRRYEVLKLYRAHYLFNFRLNGIPREYNEIKVLQTQQALLSALLQIQKNSTEKRNLADSISIPDPFIDGNIRIDQTEKTIKIHSTGPDKVFDEGIYKSDRIIDSDPDRGLNSKGDIVWEIKIN